MKHFEKDFWHYATPSVWFFLLTALYLVYISLIAQPILVNDSIGYEQLGDKMYHHGLLGYLKDSVQREPLYPFLIAIAKWCSDLSAIDHLQVLKWMQITLLMMTQILAFIILKKMAISRWLTALAVLILGSMPTLVNSTVWVYSEVLTYPLIIGAVLISSIAWQRLNDEESLNKKTVGIAIALGFCCVILTLIKAAFELIVPCLLGVFALAAVVRYLKRQYKAFTAVLLFTIIAASCYYVPVITYKWLNFKENGSFVLTNRGPWALYGYTLRRLEPLDAQRLLAAIDFTPGPKFCSKVLDQEKCDWWSIYPGDALAIENRDKLQPQYPTQQLMDQKMLSLSIVKIMENPFQFFSLMYLESFKSLFWFNDYDAQSAYPDWLDAIYQHTDLFITLSFIFALITFLAYVYLTFFVIKRIDQFFGASSKILFSDIAAFFIFIVINVYTASYALIYLTPRYILPMVPLYGLMIIIWFQFLLIRLTHAKKLF